MKERRFEYKKRDDKETKRRASQTSGMYASPFKDTYPKFKPKSGDNNLRILPPTWKNPNHYGYDVWVHNRIGASGGTYICLAKQYGETCPVCDELEKARKDGEDKEYLYKLTPKRRVAILVIDRDKEKEGPMLFDCPWSLDRDIAGVSVVKKTGRALALDDPDEGYDVSFTKSGEGLKTKYHSVVVDRSVTPLSESSKTQGKWLDFIGENPLTKCLIRPNPEELEKAVSGMDSEDGGDEDRGSSKRRNRDDEDEEPETRSSRRRGSSDDDDDERDDDGDEKPRSRRSRDEDEGDDSDDEDDRPRRKRPTRESSDDDADEEDDDKDVQRESSGRKKRRGDDDDESEDDGDDDRPSRKRRNREDDEDDDGPERSRATHLRGRGNRHGDDD